VFRFEPLKECGKKVVKMVKMGQALNLTQDNRANLNDCIALALLQGDTPQLDGPLLNGILTALKHIIQST
jgi:hypothetical protein